MSILNKLEELNNQRLRMISDIRKVGNLLPVSTKYPAILDWYKTYKDLEAPFNTTAVFEDEVVTLSWESNQNDVQYSIYKSLQPFSKEESITPIATISNKSFTDSDVVSDTTYYYRVSAVKNNVQKLSTLTNVDTEEVPVEAGDEYWDNVVSLLNFENGLLDAAKPDIGWISSSLSPIVDDGRFGKGANLSNDYRKAISGIWQTEHSISNIYTIEAWIKYDGATSTPIVVCYSDAETSSGFKLSILSNGVLYFETATAYGARNSVMGSAAPIAKGVFTHVAVSNDGTTCRLFVGGVLAGSRVGMPVIRHLKLPTHIGIGWDKGLSRYSSSTIDEFRVTKGVARYTSNFEPPSEPFPNHK